jgi:hypothetical protein
MMTIPSAPAGSISCVPELDAALQGPGMAVDAAILEARQ